MTRTERLLRLARLRGDRAAELILGNQSRTWEMRIETRADGSVVCRKVAEWTEAELREAWGR